MTKSKKEETLTDQEFFKAVSSFLTILYTNDKNICHLNFLNRKIRIFRFWTKISHKSWWNELKFSRNAPSYKGWL